MDAGACVTCQTLLGEVDLEGVLGLFPRVRCPTCGLVNVLSAGTLAAVATPQVSRGGMETAAAIDVAAYQDELPAYEEPSLDAEPAEFSEDAAYGEEEPSSHLDDEAAFAAEDSGFAGESTRIGIDIPDNGANEDEEY
jgi:hypothetical protein